MVRLTVILVAVISNPPERLTTSAFVRSKLICSQNDKVTHPDLCDAPIVVHFNYVLFDSEYLL